MTKEISQEVLNFGTGEPGNRILDLVLTTDMDLVAGWVGVGGDGGNCFFAAVQMMINLVQIKRADGFEIVTGVLAHPDRTVPAFHSWLEKGGIVLNVSNLQKRPLYVADRDAFYRNNFIAKRIQRIGPARVARMVKTCGGDIREATKRLMKPTFVMSMRAHGIAPYAQES